jgi:hypothetical protein
MLRDPKEIKLDGKTYVLSKFPCVAGREIVTQWPLSAIPRLGDYKINQELMYKIMCYVGVVVDGHKDALVLNTESLVDNHVRDWEQLMLLEKEMMAYNCSFFQGGKISSFLEDLAENLPSWISSTLIPWWRRLSSQEKQPIGN